MESFLSFLGLGVQEPMTSWGALVNDGADQAMESGTLVALVFPAVFLAADAVLLQLSWATVCVMRSIRSDRRVMIRDGRITQRGLLQVEALNVTG